MLSAVQHGFRRNGESSVHFLPDAHDPRRVASRPAPGWPLRHETAGLEPADVCQRARRQNGGGLAISKDNELKDVIVEARNLKNTALLYDVNADFFHGFKPLDRGKFRWSMSANSNTCRFEPDLHPPFFVRLPGTAAFRDARAVRLAIHKSRNRRGQSRSGFPWIPRQAVPARALQTPAALTPPSNVPCTSTTRISARNRTCHSIGRVADAGATLAGLPEGAAVGRG